MKQLTFIKKGVLEWREVPDPKLESREDAEKAFLDPTLKVVVHRKTLF
ncbi:hypothetical protein [Leptospira kmetyi]|nr:hypothetical protein [Leptospira kmetyi]